MGFRPELFVARISVDLMEITPIIATSGQRSMTGVAEVEGRIFVSGLFPLSGGVQEVTPEGLKPFSRLSETIWHIEAAPWGLWALGEKAIHMITPDGEVETVASPRL